MTDRPQGSFFGRRVGKPLRSRQKTLMESVLPELRIDITAPAPVPLSRLFSTAVSAIWLEIGFGGGEHLLHEAERLPETGFIGVEPFVAGMAKAVAAIHEAQLGNVRLYDDDAGLVLDWLPEASLAGVYQLYPDPWPKRRHWKRRFVNAANLDRLARVMQPGAPFRFASDIDSYVDQVLVLARDHPAFEWTATRSADWKTPWQPWSGTRYEQKALREGRVPRYLELRRI